MIQLWMLSLFLIAKAVLVKYSSPTQNSYYKNDKLQLHFTLQVTFFKKLCALKMATHNEKNVLSTIVAYKLKL